MTTSTQTPAEMPGETGRRRPAAYWGARHGAARDPRGRRGRRRDARCRRARDRVRRAGGACRRGGGQGPDLTGAAGARGRGARGRRWTASARPRRGSSTLDRRRPAASGASWARSRCSGGPIDVAAGVSEAGVGLAGAAIELTDLDRRAPRAGSARWRRREGASRSRSWRSSATTSRPRRSRPARRTADRSRHPVEPDPGGRRRGPLRGRGTGRAREPGARTRRRHWCGDCRRSRAPTVPAGTCCSPRAPQSSGAPVASGAPTRSCRPTTATLDVGRFFPILSLPEARPVADPTAEPRLPPELRPVRRRGSAGAT